MTYTDDTRKEADGVASGGYAAARLRLLTEQEPSGRSRRAALARLTDEWLAGLFTVFAIAFAVAAVAALWLPEWRGRALED